MPTECFYLLELDISMLLLLHGRGMAEEAKKLHARVIFRLAEELHHRLKLVAVRRRVPMRVFVEDAIRTAVEVEDESAPPKSESDAA